MQHDDSPSIQEESFYNTQRNQELKSKMSKALKGNLFGQDPPIDDIVKQPKVGSKRSSPGNHADANMHHEDSPVVTDEENSS